jgi:hypothetical protein
MRRVEAARYEYRFAIVVFTYVMEQKCSYCPEAERTFGRPPLMGQVIAEPGWSLLSAQAKMLLIQAIRSVRPPGAGDGARTRSTGREIAAVKVRTNWDKAQRLYDELGEAPVPKAKRRRRQSAMTFTKRRP